MKVPYIKDNLHSPIDYKKLIEIQSLGVESKISDNSKVKKMTKTISKTSYKGGRKR